MGAADSLELMLALAMNTAELNKQRKAQVAAVRSDLKQAEKERDEALPMSRTACSGTWTAAVPDGRSFFAHGGWSHL